MDEQQDQVVLEEIETDADYDYLSILREMQDSLSADQEPSIVHDATGDNSEAARNKVFDAQTFESRPPQPLAEDFPANGYSADFAQEDVRPEDYLANAKTQPLPALSPDFHDDLNNSQSDQTNLNNFSAHSNDTPAEDLIAFETANEADNLESPSSPQNGLAVQFHDHSFHDFAEMSPILFDSNEQIETAEPNFETDLPGEAATETTPEMTTETSAETSAANSSGDLTETTIDNAVVRADEMPTNLAFGEMFAEDLVAQPVAPVVEAPPLEIDEETEAEFTTLLAGLEELENNNLDLPTKPLDEFPQPIAAGSFEDYAGQDLQTKKLTENAANERESSSAVTVSDDALDFGLPEAMLLKENSDNFAPEPVFAALDEEAETAFETIEESLPDAQTKDFEASTLAVPSFLQAELNLAKQSESAESLPANLSATENSAETIFDNASQEDAAAGLRSLAHEILHAAPPLGSGDVPPQQNFQADFASNAAELLLADFTVANKVQETPETAVIENPVINREELNYPDDFAQGNSMTLLANQADNSAPDWQTEMPESLLLNNFETELPEVDFAEFDLQPIAVANPSLSNHAVAIDSKQNSAQNSAAQSLLQEMSDFPKSVSFLKERFVIFKLDDTLYAFPAVNVAEIGQLLPITPLPFVPSWFLGISNLRGDILSVVGLRELWEKNAAPPNKAKILVVHSEKQALTVGLVVDAVREMRHVTPEEIFSDDSNTESHFAPYQIGMVEYEGQNLCLLNAEKLLETLRS